MEVKENSPISQSPGKEEYLHLFCFCSHKRSAFCGTFQIHPREQIPLDYSEAYEMAVAAFLNLKKN